MTVVQVVARFLFSIFLGSVSAGLQCNVSSCFLCAQGIPFVGWKALVFFCCPHLFPNLIIGPLPLEEGSYKFRPLCAHMWHNCNKNGHFFAWKGLISFCMELDVHEGSKVTWSGFLWKFLLGPYQAERGQLRPKMDIFNFELETAH